MAKATANVKKQNKINLENLSQRDRDFLSLEVKDTMKKYKVEKQGVYDRRFALNKKLREAGLTVEQALNGSAAETTPQPAEKKAVKKAAKKAVKKVYEPVHEEQNLLPAVIEKNVPVIMKPIEINFENFSVRLNGVPKKISVNPETHAIEIDL